MLRVAWRQGRRRPWQIVAADPHSGKNADLVTPAELMPGKAAKWTSPEPDSKGRRSIDPAVETLDFTTRAADLEAAWVNCG
jgi:hypothetical protein